jgi:N-methylhydantoinase B/oxoprolinase/acetone carboxylase alpha subunit
VVGAIFNALDRDLPRNAGSFRRLRFTCAETGVVRAPVFPHSCSMGTTNVSERLVNITQSAFAQLGDEHGLSEGGTGLGAGMALISLPNVVQVALQKGQVLRGRDSASGGYGSPLNRDLARVLHDVLEGWESRRKAHDIYGVVFTGATEDDSLAVDQPATAALRATGLPCC